MPLNVIININRKATGLFDNGVKLNDLQYFLSEHSLGRRLARERPNISYNWDKMCQEFSQNTKIALSNLLSLTQRAQFSTVGDIRMQTIGTLMKIPVHPKGSFEHVKQFPYKEDFSELLVLEIAAHPERRLRLERFVYREDSSQITVTQSITLLKLFKEYPESFA